MFVCFFTSCFREVLPMNRPNDHPEFTDHFAELEEILKTQNVVKIIINHPQNHHKWVVFVPFPNA